MSALRAQKQIVKSMYAKRGLSNTPKLSPMEEGHEQPDSPEDSSRET